MIKNIIFDMGNVLVRFDPYRILEEHDIKDPEDIDLLLRNIFYSEGWSKMDLGIYVEDDLYNEAITKLPVRLHRTAREILDTWYESLTPINGIKELVTDLKKRKLNIYLLSNAGKSKDIYWSSIPAHECFDGGIVSAFVGCVKPDKKIFDILLEKYGLKAEECIFTDDMKKNIDAAGTMGINTFLFEGDVEALRRYIFESLDK